MKKMLICSNHLDYGGIESALVNLLNTFDFKNYDVTLLLMNNKGHLIDRVPKNIKIIDIKYNRSKFKVYKKIINIFKTFKYSIKFKKKFDVSICYSPFIQTCTRIAKCASDNTIVWLHTDYYEFFKGNVHNLKVFERKMGINKFNKLVFVNENSMYKYLDIFERDNIKNFYFIPNIIDGARIIEKSECPIKESKPQNKVLFINVSRHEEKSKRISRIIEAADKLCNSGINNFEIWLVGSGEDSALYKNLILNKKLDNYIHMLGNRDNPYPYMRLADCILITSDFEGDPVTFYEGLCLEKNIITTNIGNVHNFSNYPNVHIIDKSVNSLSNNMEKFVDINKNNNFKKFDYEQYNIQIFEKIQKVIGDSK